MYAEFVYFGFIAILGVSSQFEKPPVTRHCVGCICEAVSDCNISSICSGDVCGPFRITRPYWSDGGKLTINKESPDSPNAYQNCAKDTYCSAHSLQGYMLMYQKDCNDDGVIDCDDYAAIHILGAYGCADGVWPKDFKRRYDKCKSVVGLKLSKPNIN